MEQLGKEFSIIYINETGLKLNETDLIRAIQGAEYIIAGTEKFSETVLKSTKCLRAISRVGVGTDSIDLAEASARDIRVLTTPEAPVVAVSEHALALLLAALKRIPQYNAAVRSGDHSIGPGSLLSGKTVGIIGLGRVGRRLSEVLACMGCRIQYFDPYLVSSSGADWTPVLSLEELVRTSDIISIHASPDRKGAPIIDVKILGECKKGMTLINTARGSLIDEPALEQAVKDGTIASAGLDVFSDEPYRGPLLQYPQIIVTPHVASNTRESRAQMEHEAVNNLILQKRSVAT